MSTEKLEPNEIDVGILQIVRANSHRKAGVVIQMIRGQFPKVPPGELMQRVGNVMEELDD